MFSLLLASALFFSPGSDWKLIYDMKVEVCDIKQYSPAKTQKTPTEIVTFSAFKEKSLTSQTAYDFMKAKVQEENFTEVSKCHTPELIEVQWSGAKQNHLVKIWPESGILYTLLYTWEEPLTASEQRARWEKIQERVTLAE